MDLNLYARVLWRFRLLVAIGLVLGLSLALLSVVKVSFANGLSVSYREPPVWQSEAKLLISQPGFPEGRAIPGYRTAGTGGPPTPSTDPARLSSLSYLYAEIANGDEVKRRFLARRGPSGKYFAQAYTVTTPSAYSTALPMLLVSSLSSTPRNAVVVARNAAGAFRDYLGQQQADAGIPEDERVVVPLLQGPAEIRQVGGPKKTIPVVVLFAVLIATIGLAFVLENANPQLRVVRELDPDARARRPA